MVRQTLVVVIPNVLIRAIGDQPGIDLTLEPLLVDVVPDLQHRGKPTIEEDTHA